MTANFVDIYRHFGSEAEKVLLGRLGLSSRNEYFFEYDRQYLASFPNPFPVLLKFSAGLQQTQSGRFPHFLIDSLPDDWGRMLVNKELRKRGLFLNEITYIDRLRYLGDNAMGSLSFSPMESREILEDNLKFREIEALNQDALTAYEDDSDGELERLNRISSACGGSKPKGNLYFSKDLCPCHESWQPNFDAWIVKFKTHSTVLASEEGVCEYIYSQLAKQSGITLPNTHLFELSDSHLFAIQRFDREDKRRIFSASAAGLLGLDWRAPSLDYE